MPQPLPYISVRKYIKWGDDPAGENTNTVVLTTPQKNYVDIRTYLPTSPSHPPKLEWGFAGTSVSTPATATSPAHTVWTHWVDSKTTEEVQDEGNMHPQANGETLEYGVMVNPDRGTGIREKYEECWIDQELDKEEGQRRGWVLKTEGEGGRGVMARIGGVVQGVLRKGERISIGRWNVKGEVAERVLRILELKLPVVGEVVKEGDVVKDEDGLEWTCIEVFGW